MKTKELIKRLQEVDPSGETEVCVDNEDILFVSREPAYYDGCFQVLDRDPAKTHCYNVVGIEIRGQGDKIAIHPHGTRWALIDNPEMPVKFDSEYSKKHNSEYVEKLREEYRQLDKDIKAGK